MGLWPNVQSEDKSVSEDDQQRKEWKLFYRKRKRIFMEDLTVSEDNDHLRTSVRDGKEPSQSLNVAYWKNFATRG